MGDYVLLVFVEISTYPGHCDNKGEDCETDDEEEFVTHDVGWILQDGNWCERRGRQML